MAANFVSRFGGSGSSTKQRHKTKSKEEAQGYSAVPSPRYSKIDHHHVIMSSFTESQLIAFAMLPKISAVLSSFGSIWILVEVTTNFFWKNKNNGAGSSNNNSNSVAYQRILGAMAVYDLLESVFNFISTWAIPSDTSDIWQAYGKHANMRRARILPPTWDWQCRCTMHPYRSTTC